MWDRLLLQSASGIRRCDRLYYKVHQVLQSVTVITKWYVTKQTVLCVCVHTELPVTKFKEEYLQSLRDKVSYINKKNSW